MTTREDADHARPLSDYDNHELLQLCARAAVAARRVAADDWARLFRLLDLFNRLVTVLRYREAWPHDELVRRLYAAIDAEQPIELHRDTRPVATAGHA